LIFCFYFILFILSYLLLLFLLFIFLAFTLRSSYSAGVELFQRGYGKIGKVDAANIAFQTIEQGMQTSR
jgi:hypothetical protein